MSKELWCTLEGFPVCTQGKYSMTTPPASLVEEGHSRTPSQEGSILLLLFVGAKLGYEYS